MGQPVGLMARIDLKHVQRFKDRHGKVRHYFRRPGFSRVTLPGEPGSAEFMEAYAAAMSAAPESAGKTPAEGTISALLVAYYASDDWKSLQPQTQYVYRGVLERFRQQHGDKRARMMQPHHVQMLLDKVADKPGAAKNLLKRLRGLFAFARARRLIDHDPTAGVTLAKRKSEGFRAWTEADIEKFEEMWPEGSRARLALNLLLYTGQRRSDVVLMGRQHLRNGCLLVRQQKLGADAPVLEIPLHPVLKRALDALPKENLTFLMTGQGKPFSPVGFSNWFSQCAKDAGLPARSSPHGLRKAAGRRLAEAGCSAHEIAAITGHASLKEVERYTKSARQAKLARSAIRLLGGEE